MKTILRLLIVIIGSSLFVMSCNTGLTTNKINIPDEIKSIEVKQLVDEKKSFVITDQDTLNEFQNVFDRTNKMNGIVSMIEPIHSLIITYTNDTSEEVLLWINDDPNEKSSLMNNSDTHTLYTVPKEMTGILIELVLLELE
ncbi:hypothetical protein [Alkalicoccobacillus gibsonii]|uniref:hypothetical protein n=1 Tax=Alkalicoccobacillus gibsonii TaxID=79881 RepID=UPI0035117673